MSKGPTKAQQALAEAREWIEASKEEVKEREAALIEAQGQLVMHETIYAILEKTLTRQSSVKSSAQKSTTKRAGKKSASKGASKSPRAQSLSGVIQRTPKVKIDDDDTDPSARCQKEFAGGFICDEPADANVHHLRGATGYHEFDTGKSPAPRAGAKSSTNGGAIVTTANSGDETVSAGAVAGGSSE